MAEIVLDGITKRYGDGTEAVRGLDLHVRDGGFMILVGPSGCGKSTALRMVAGLEEISEGELRIDDRVANGLEPRDRDIAMVFQNYALYPHMTVRQNMSFALKMAKRPKAEIEERVQEAAGLLGLEELLDRRPANLSGGQRQRVAMGRAIVRKPAVFLMDEPLSNLDAKLRVQTRAELARLQSRLGTTTLYVTHDQTEAMTLGDRVAVLRAGELQQVATPDELYRHPSNVFVAGFIGSPAMNLLPAHSGAAGGITVGAARVVIDRLAPVDRDLVVGIRPEHLHVDAAGELEVEVDLVESTGSDRHAYATLDGIEDQLVVRIDADLDVARGARLRLRVDADEVHLFDAQTEQRIEG